MVGRSLDWVFSAPYNMLQDALKNSTIVVNSSHSILLEQTIFRATFFISDSSAMFLSVDYYLGIAHKSTRKCFCPHQNWHTALQCFFIRHLPGHVSVCLHSNSLNFILLTQSHKIFLGSRWKKVSGSNNVNSSNTERRAAQMRTKGKSLLSPQIYFHFDFIDELF